MSLTKSDINKLTKWKRILSYENILKIHQWQDRKIDELDLNDKKSIVPIFQRMMDEHNDGPLLYEDKKVIVITPRTQIYKIHLLVIPKKRIFNASMMTKKDIPILKYMDKIGHRIAKKFDTNGGKIKTGFHLYPTNSVNYLHMHVYQEPHKINKLKRCYFPTHRVITYLSQK